MTFDVAAIGRHGWRQGAVLGPALRSIARTHAPVGIEITDDDWLIVTSHDCDVVNDILDKEPVVEVLRGTLIKRPAPDKQQIWGRNPRILQIGVETASGSGVVLGLKVHDRWTLPREALSVEPPASFLPEKERRLIAEWLAKRYIRAAFPSAFDGRWRSKLRDWTKLLESHSTSVQGVYLRLSTLRELDRETPYSVHLIVAAPVHAKLSPDWATRRDMIAEAVEAFWAQFSPSIECAGVDVLCTDQLTLADIEPYQRFDADWVSFADDSASMQLSADMKV